MYGIDNEEDSTWIQVLQKCGLYAKLIECVRNGDVTVRFEDGCIVRHVSKKDFCNGNVIHPKYRYKRVQKRLKKEEYIGKKVLQKRGQYAEIIYIQNNTDITVKFDDGTVRDNIKLKKFLNGELVSICDRALIEKFVIEKRVTIGNIHWLRLVKKANGKRIVGTLEEVLSDGYKE